MAFRKKKIIPLIWLLFSTPLFSQQTTTTEIDSLLAQSERLLKTQTDSALKLAFKAAELSQTNGSATHLVRSYAAIGDGYDLMDDYDKRIYYYEKAVDASSGITDEKLKARMILQLGSAYYNKGNYDKASELLNQAKILTEKLNDADLKYSFYGSLGTLYMMGSRNADSSAKYFNLALQLALLKNDSSRI